MKENREQTCLPALEKVWAGTDTKAPGAVGAAVGVWKKDERGLCYWGGYWEGRCWGKEGGRGLVEQGVKAGMWPQEPEVLSAVLGRLCSWVGNAIWGCWE